MRGREGSNTVRVDGDFSDFDPCEGSVHFIAEVVIDGVIRFIRAVGVHLNFTTNHHVHFVGRHELSCYPEGDNSPQSSAEKGDKNIPDELMAAVFAPVFG